MHAVAPVGGGTQLETRSAARLASAAHEFEAQMMKELLRPLATNDGDDEKNGSAGALTDFAAEALGRSLSLAGGFGIADRIMANIHVALRDGSGTPEKSSLRGLKFTNTLPISSAGRIVYGDPK